VNRHDIVREMRAAGETWRACGKALGVSGTRAKQILVGAERRLAEERADFDDDLLALQFPPGCRVRFLNAMRDLGVRSMAELKEVEIYGPGGLANKQNLGKKTLNALFEQIPELGES
jgi:hypothetical protein